MSSGGGDSHEWFSKELGKKRESTGSWKSSNLCKTIECYIGV